MAGYLNLNSTWLGLGLGSGLGLERFWPIFLQNDKFVTCGRYGFEIRGGFECESGPLGFQNLAGDSNLNSTWLGVR